ncbi:protein kinase [Nocardia sp. CA2R105]|uniref:WD40 repeat domain-containing serine/threonine protein kinase n=1 Tax=Nocardia coffeae TaxID=2873381 RepID=UPI001CA670F2|nr:serine/threonine-protein kinase [Nocardia coffeae]MBY8860543.1 protein kinase [Nocardia coffeae]
MNSDENDLAATQSVSWQPGDVIADRYEVRDVVRTGGMGVVYRVWHREWQVELAVKTPRPELLDSARHVRGFEEEAEAWVGLGVHPNTVSCMYVRHLDGAPRVFAEWVDGGSLAEAIRSRRLYDGDRSRVLGRLLDIAIQCAWGLDHAHANRLIHQDVKPANVMLARDGTVKVTDFGLANARIAAGEIPGGRPAASVIAGFGGMTPAYCSPEQAAAAQDRAITLTRATDVWSWAISVWEMFTGATPCRFGQTAGAAFESFLADGHASDGIPPLPKQLAMLLRSCLTLNPAARPKSAGRLARALIELYAEVIGEPYPRPWPNAEGLRADRLSNHALSLLDLGRPELAENLWREALDADRYHPHARYNYGLYRWRRGRILDTEFVAELAAVRDRRPDAVIDHLLGLVHLERGDTASARRHLGRAARSGPPDPEVDAALRLARNHPDEPEPLVLQGHSDTVCCVSIAADGRTAASGSIDGTVRVWDLEVGSCRHVLHDRRRFGRSCGPIDAVAVSGDGTRVAAHGRDGTLLVWDGVTGDRQHRIADVRATSIAIGVDGDLLVSGGAPGGPVQVWDLARGRVFRVLREQNNHHRDAAPGSVGLTANNRLAIEYDAHDGETRVWEAGSGRLVHSVDRFTGFALDTHAGQAISRKSMTSIEPHRPAAMVIVWHVDSVRTSRATSIPPDRFAGPTAFSSDTQVVTANDQAPSGPVVEVWELGRDRCLRTFHGHTAPITSIALSHDGRTAVSGSHDHTVRAWPVRPAGPAGQWSIARLPIR